MCGRLQRRWSRGTCTHAGETLCSRNGGVAMTGESDMFNMALQLDMFDMKDARAWGVG